MIKEKPTILIVDDAQYNIKLISAFLKKEPYNIVSFTEGEEAWKTLLESPEKFDTILLDRVMPGVSGMEFLQRTKSNNLLKTIPVIFQTSRDSREEILEGLRAGAYYYLTKPLEKDTFLAVIKTAVSDYGNYKHLKHEVNQTTNTLKLMTEGNFEFSSLKQAKTLSALLANMCPDPEKVVLGIWELLINAVEHGNLGITYEEKSALNDTKEWHHEIERRLALPENSTKKVTVKVNQTEDDISFIIRDDGPGFDWKNYINLSPDRVFDNHGRGIAMAGLLSFDKVDYRGKGNEALAIVRK
ncbi:MAG: response regulator [Leptospiraceae bacterium]|nr:response regulator [Leptospiraceae bacterium]MCP5497821.1 response regulator [Leptospiraceae bacterium]